MNNKICKLNHCAEATLSNFYISHLQGRSTQQSCCLPLAIMTTIKNPGIEYAYDDCITCAMYDITKHPGRLMVNCLSFDTYQSSLLPSPRHPASNREPNPGATEPCASGLAICLSPYKSQGVDRCKDIASLERNGGQFHEITKSENCS